ncbi:NYN domain-containing protein [Novosphingobium flavum]|uniref:NYN domain-containing protein n=2 Tax=Novosphingobium flavum TaxID=1778672 RepID=A0A7X1FQ02_9SPHN|nr:NYN domain-containing protein [Novosphingobium flavum]
MNAHATLSFRRIALLIDADNVSAARLPTILAELAKHGTPGIRRAYGDWTTPALKGWKETLHEFAIRPVQQFSYSKGKNATDMALVIDAMELLYTQKIDAFGIVSSDADFTPLVMHLKAAGQDVFGFGERKTPEPFVNACTDFLYLENPAALPGGPEDPEKPSPRAGSPTSDNPAAPRLLAQDTKLVNALRGAVEASARDDGWALLAQVGSAARRVATIDPRNYGAKTFTDLFAKTGLFEIFHRPGEQPWVADKRNKERSKEPCVPISRG